MPVMVFAFARTADAKRARTVAAILGVIIFLIVERTLLAAGEFAADDFEFYDGAESAFAVASRAI